MSLKTQVKRTVDAGVRPVVAVPNYKTYLRVRAIMTEAFNTSFDLWTESSYKIQLSIYGETLCIGFYADGTMGWMNSKWYDEEGHTILGRTLVIRRK